MGGRREFTFSFYWLDGDPPHVAILSHSGFIRASTCTFPASTLVYDMTKVAISGLAQEPGALYAHTTLSFSFHTLPFLYNMLDKAFQERERKVVVLHHVDMAYPDVDIDSWGTNALPNETTPQFTQSRMPFITLK